MNDHFQALFKSALQDYEKQTGIPLTDHPLADKLQNCQSVDSVTTLLQEQSQAFNEFRGRDKITKPLKGVVSVLSKVSAAVALGQDFGLSFPPADAINTGLGILLSAFDGVSSDFDSLVDLLESIEHFLRRLDIYTKVPPTPAMTEIVVKIMVELLSTLALVTKQIKQGRSKKFVKKLFGENEVDAVLQRLDRLTQDEARTTAAQTLEVVYGLVQSMKAIMDDGKASADNVRNTLEIIQEMASEMNKSKREKLEKNIRRWLSPPDPRKNHNLSRGARHTGTAVWFIGGSTLSDWKSSGPSSLLWVHGKPGAGKSVLCSTIIENINSMRKLGLASLAFFYCNFREDEKRDLRGLLSSMLIQLCYQSDSYSRILSDFYSENENGLQDPSDEELARCLKDMLEVTGQAPVYLIVDGLDECSNTSALPPPREKVLTFLEDLVGSQIPTLRICVTSRTEIDIKEAIEPLTFRSVCLHDASEQKKDIDNYIRSVVNTDPKMRKWEAADRELVIDVLIKNSDGVFRWVYYQILYLRRCIPGHIRNALDELPEMGQEEIARLLVEHGADSATRVNDGSTAIHPTSHKEVARARLERGTDSATQANNGSAAVHPSSNKEVSRVLREHGVDTAAKSKDGWTQLHSISHWGHAEIASLLLEHDADPEAQANDGSTALHLASNKEVACVLLEHGASTKAKNNNGETPLHSISHWGHAEIARLLLEYGADLEAQADDGSTALHYASNKEVARVLLEKGASTKPKTNDGSTPLHSISHWGHADIAHLILEQGADSEAQSNDGSTALHLASNKGVARVLLEHGASTKAKKDNGETPLHSVSHWGHADIVRLLLEHGADSEAQSNDGSTALHYASNKEVARVLLEKGASTKPKTDDGSTPLHSISHWGHADIARLLLEHGADSEAQSNDGSTALHYASNKEVARVLLEKGASTKPKTDDGSTPLHSISHWGHADIARLLLEQGADSEAQSNDGSTALHLASNKEVARVLLEHGASTKAKKDNGETPLHSVSHWGHADIVRLLLDHGADSEAQANDGCTAFHYASNKEVARVLLEHGASITAKSNDGSTPLHSVSYWGHADIVRLLLEHGADPTAQTDDGSTAFHLTSNKEISRVLLEYDLARKAQTN